MLQRAYGGEPLSKLLPIQKYPPQGKVFFCIDGANAMNLELLLSPEYYLATMSLYEEIKRNNIKSLKLLQTFDNDISLNEAIYYKN